VLCGVARRLGVVRAAARVVARSRELCSLPTGCNVRQVADGSSI